MTLREPESMEECVYFTNRAIDNGHAKAWVFREKCPKCKKGMMSKPFDEKEESSKRAQQSMFVLNASTLLKKKNMKVH